ncbi:MAG: hypothetical protein UT24_C0016G0001, partial [Candidatus Woesebacteria bacterium GW2011_GWB1_39_12]
MLWTPGNNSNSQTLTDDDDIYPSHVNELRTAADIIATANPASFTLIKSGSNYIAYDDTGTAVSTSTDFAVPLQYAINNLPTSGGKIVIKGGSTYTFTVAHYAVGDTVAQTMKIGADLNNNNIHIVIEKGATITQAASLQLQVFFAGNIAGTGNGEV